MKYLLILLLTTSYLYSEKAVLQLSEKGRVGINFDEHHEPEANLDINGFLKLQAMPEPPSITRDGMIYLSTDGSLYLYFSKQWHQIQTQVKQPLVDLTFYADIIASSQLGGNSSPSNILYGNSRDWISDLKETKPWLKLSWEIPQKISKILLGNRNHQDSIIESGTINFPNGEIINFGPCLPNEIINIEFPQKNTQTFTLNLNYKSATKSNGIALLQVFGEISKPKYDNLTTPDLITSSSIYTQYYDRNNVLSLHNGDWASKGEVNPWIKFEWNEKQTLNTILLKDRANNSDHSKDCDISFSDGTSIKVQNLANNGEKKVVHFPQKTITWVKIDVQGAPNSSNNGFELVKFEKR